MMFPDEPVGKEEAIGWHLRQIDYHDHNASMAEAMDAIGSMRWHDARRKEHEVRLAKLEAELPETAKIARSDLEVEYRAMGEEP